MRKIRLNILHLLLPVSLVLIILSFVLPHYSLIQLQLAMLAVILYVALSFIHHYFDKTLSLEVSLEYVLLATLALIMMAGAFI